MKEKNPVPIETLLQQMSLQKPSSNLDQSIQQTLNDDDGALPMIGEPSGTVSNLPVSSGNGRQRVRQRGWHWLVTAGCSLAAATGGWLLGVSFPGNVPQLPGQDSALVEPDDSSSINLASNSTLPLNGTEPRIVDEGFQFLDGKPSRVYRVEGLEKRPSGSGVRKKIVVPSSEI